MDSFSNPSDTRAQLFRLCCLYFGVVVVAIHASKAILPFIVMQSVYMHICMYICRIYWFMFNKQSNYDDDDKQGTCTRVLPDYISIEQNDYKNSTIMIELSRNSSIDFTSIHQAEWKRRRRQ